MRGRSLHLDTTSLTLFGKHDGSASSDDLQPNQGQSKDHRPDIKQMVKSLKVNGPVNVPLWFEALSGNSKDRKNFHDTISTFEAFRKAIEVPDDFLWVADSALLPTPGPENKQQAAILNIVLASGYYL